MACICSVQMSKCNMSTSPAREHAALICPPTWNKLSTIWGKWVFCMKGFCSPPIPLPHTPRQVYLFCPFLSLRTSVPHLWNLWSLGKSVRTSQLSLSESLEPKRGTFNFQQEKKIAGQVYMGVKKKCHNAILSSLPPVLLSKPLVEVSSQVSRLSASSGRVVHCPFRKKNHEQPKLYQLTLFVFCIFQCLVLKNQGGEMVVAIQSKGENWFWNWGTLLQVRASVLNM